MGRIKTKMIKRLTKKLMKSHSDSFSEDFGKNKALTAKWTTKSSPKIRNIIAGSVTRLKKKGYQEGQALPRAPPQQKYSDRGDMYGSSDRQGRRGGSGRSRNQR